jgi:hypothetical protein
VRGFYWSDPSKELDLTEQYTKKRGSAPIEIPRGIYIHPGGHIVQISENNISTLVASHGKIFPKNSLYHARDVKVSDCTIYGNIHITMTCSGEIQFAPLRAVSGDLVPRYTFTEEKLLKGRPQGSQGCHLPLKGLAKQDTRPRTLQGHMDLIRPTG